MTKMEESIRVLCRWSQSNRHKKKTAQLLHFTGMDLQDLFEDLVDPGPAPERDDVYQKAIRKLDNRFKPEDNFTYERHVFRQMAMKAKPAINLLHD